MFISDSIIYQLILPQIDAPPHLSNWIPKLSPPHNGDLIIQIIKYVVRNMFKKNQLSNIRNAYCCSYRFSVGMESLLCSLG